MLVYVGCMLVYVGVCWCMLVFDYYNGGIMGNRKTDLVVLQGNINAQRYVADVLNEHALPCIRQHGPGVPLMQDNAGPHVARVTTRFLQQNNVNVMSWPAASSDLNPIELIWDQPGRKARANHQIDNVRDLTRALQQEWRNLPNALVLRYVTSMRRMIIACILANGGHICFFIHT